MFKYKKIIKRKKECMPSNAQQVSDRWKFEHPFWSFAIKDEEKSEDSDNVWW